MPVEIPHIVIEATLKNRWMLYLFHVCFTLLFHSGPRAALYMKFPAVFPDEKIVLISILTKLFLSKCFNQIG